MKILANDGISQTGIDFLQDNGFQARVRPWRQWLTTSMTIR